MASTTSTLITITIFTTLLFFISPSTAQNTNILYSGDRLYSGQSLTLNSYSFTMQSDCNLVLYDYGSPVWASNTGGRSYNCYLTLQTDGNLVIYDGNGRAIWASNTGRNQGYFVLVLQPDRNVVIYGGAIWATASNRVGNGVTIEKTANVGGVVVNEIVKKDDEKIVMVTMN